MTERRPLTEGLKAVDAGRATEEERFVYNAPPAARPVPAVPRTPPRVNLHTQIRQDYADALKRASLERRLSGETPNMIQEIVEEALGPWLASQGYLTKA